jgi:hypothetical protein
LAVHLLRTDTNERVEVIEMRGTLAQSLAGAFQEMEAVGSGTRCRKPLYHASIAPDPRFSMTREQWQEAIAALEQRMRLANQPRVVVMHLKEGREHCHVVWSRIDAERMKAIPDGHNFRRHEETARDLERRFGHELVQGAHAERGGRKRPKRTPSRADIQQQERHAKSGRAAVGTVKRITEELTALWHQTSSGREFADALAARGYVLARGDRRDFVVVDSVGAVHSLTRRIEGVKAAAVRERMADVDRDGLPSVAEAKAHQAARQIAQDAAKGAGGRFNHAVLWRHSAPRVTVPTRIGGLTPSGWGGVWSRRACPPFIRRTWRPAARKHTARQEQREERPPFRPHRHGEGFHCNGCKEWHPEGVMHCEFG